LNSDTGPAKEKSAVQILDFNGVPAWNGFRSCSISPAVSRVSSQRMIRRGTGGDDGSIKKQRSTETAISFDGTLGPQNLKRCLTLARRRAKLAGQMKDSVLPGDTHVAAGAAVPVNEVASAPRLRQTPSKLGQRQAKMLAESTRVLMPDRLTVEAKASAETDVLNPLQKHYTTHEIAAAWNVHPVTVYRDFVDEKGVVKLGSGRPRRRTRRELRIPESVLMRVYDKRRTKIKVQAICGFVQSFLHGGHKWRVMLLSGLNGFMAQE